MRFPLLLQRFVNYTLCVPKKLFWEQLDWSNSLWPVDITWVHHTMVCGYYIAKRFCSKYFITLICLSICLKMTLHQTVGLWLEEWVWSNEISRQCCDRFSCHLVLGVTVCSNTSLELSIWHRRDSTHMCSHSKSSLTPWLELGSRTLESRMPKLS